MKTDLIQAETTASSVPRRSSSIGGNDRADSILLRLDAIRADKGLQPYVLGISGCDRRVGVSTVAGNLAVRAAALHLGRILLVDCNVEHPRQDANFAMKNNLGLVDLICDEAQSKDVIVNGRVKDLHVIAAGKSEGRVIVPDLVNSVMKSLQSDYDLIILDLPPIKNTARSLLFNRFVDGIALVIDARKTRARDAQAAIQILDENNVEVVGTILNRTGRTLPRWLERWL